MDEPLGPPALPPLGSTRQLYVHQQQPACLVEGKTPGVKVQQ